MNIGQLDGQPLALQIFNGMTAESICVNERWAKDQLFRCVCFAGGQIKSTPSIAWRTLCFNPRPPCGGRQQKQRKISICIHYNTAICTDLQPKQSAYASICTDRDKQSPEKLVRSIRVRSARFTFARPMPLGEALRKSARHPDGRRGELRCVQPCFDNGCPAGKSAGCPLPGRSIWPVRP